MAGAAIKSAQQQVACPGTPSVTLGLASNFRPETRFSQPQPANDLGISHIYTQGNVPVGYGVPQVISARIVNNGTNATAATTASINITGVNAFVNSAAVPALAPGAAAVVIFPAYTPTVIGANTISVTIPADDVAGNNVLNQAQTTSKDINSYAYSTPPITQGVGFTGATGDFVGQFFSADNFGNSDTINGFQVFFTSTGQPYQVGVWTDNAGAPGTNIYTTATQTTAAGTVFISLPDVVVSGTYYVGIRQTGTTNVGFGYQVENPVRAGDFYFTSPTGNTVWTDFSPGANFRISATVQYKTPVPPNCAVYLTPANVGISCQNGTTLTWGSGGGGPTGYRVYFGTNQALVEAEDPGTLVQNSAATSYPTGLLAPATTYYWRVTAFNGEGDASGCATLSRSFSTNLVSCYCVSSSANAAFEFISNVQSGAFSNPSIGTTYTNFTGLGVINDVNIGSTFNIVVTQPLAQVYDEDRIYVFADFNQDGDWNDVGELCGNADVTIANGNVTVVTCTVPVTALSGNTLLRIKLGDEVSVTTMDNTPCQVGFAFGEVEDYLLNITCGATATATTPACENAVMNFTATYLGNSTPSTYLWSGPNGFTSAIATPSIPVLALTDAGTYVVTITDAAACVSTASVTIAVSPAPILTVGSDSPRCDGTALNLNSSGGVGYSWSGPNGFNDVTQNPVINNVTGLNAGTYTVTITDGFGCSASGTELVVVNPNPSLTILSQTDVGCTAGADGAFTVDASGGTPPYFYDENGNNNFTGIFTNYSAGSYSVNVTDANTCTSASIPVIIGTANTAPPTGGCSITSAPVSGCINDVVAVSSNVVTNATSYTWSAPAGCLINGLASPQTTVSNTVSITLSPTLPGNSSGWQICVFASNGCGQTNTSCTWIRGSLSTPAAITGSTVACPNTGPTNYSTAAVTGASSYLWTITGDASVSGSGTTGAVTFGPSFTTGQLCVRALLPCGYQSAQRCMTIANGTPLLGSMIGTFSVCPGTNGVAYSVPVSVGAASYTWTVPAGATIAGGQGNNAITVDFAPSYVVGNICVFATSVCGTQSLLRCRTVVSNKPNTPGNITGASTGVCGSTISYSIGAVTGATSYTWSITGGASFTTANGSTTIDVLYPGGYTTGQLCVTANNGCGSSAPRCVTIKGTPANPGVITGPTTVCANDASVAYSIAAVAGATSYVWTLPAGATFVSGQGSVSIVIDYGVVGGVIGVTASSPCGVSGTRTLAITMNCKLSSSTLPGATINAYPNPVSTQLNVELDAVAAGTYAVFFNDTATTELIDVAGRVIYTNEMVATEGLNNNTIDVATFAKGVYTLSVKNADGFAKQIRVAVQ
ncbi:MAG: T9SS type A sorting domain-containing protein [Bacteroidetes bacterium]|nr:T9SS type A sorting domain-containing protein [Bacteroidota bacterium]